MRIAMFVTLILSAVCTGCATTKPNEKSFERTAKVCVYNGLSAWMKSGFYLNAAGICYENEKTQEVDL